MSTEDKKGKRKRRKLWGWISTIIGGLFTLVGGFSALVCCDGCDLDLESLFNAWALIFMVGGIPLLLLGINRIRKK